MFEENHPSLESADDTVEKRIDAMAKMDNVNDKSFNAVNWQVAMDHIDDKNDKKSAKVLYKLLTEPMTKVFEKAVKEGSLKDSEAGGKDVLNRLHDLGLLAPISEKGETLNAVTLLGSKFFELAGGKVEEEKKDDKEEKSSESFDEDKH
jgi:hypothetical protein